MLGYLSQAGGDPTTSNCGRNRQDAKWYAQTLLLARMPASFVSEGTFGE